MPSHSTVMPGSQNLQNLSNCSHREQSYCYCHSNSHSWPKSQNSCSIPTPPFCGTAPLVFMTDFKSTAKGKNSIKKPQQISLQTESIDAISFGRDGEENNFFLSLGLQSLRGEMAGSFPFSVASGAHIACPEIKELGFYYPISKRSSLIKTTPP